MLLQSLVFLIFYSIISSSSSEYPAVTFEAGNDGYVLSNGYVQLNFDLKVLKINGIYADFNGNGKYEVNILSKPFQFEAAYEKPTPVCLNVNSDVSFSIIQQSDDEISFEYSGSDCHEHYSQQWTISLKRAARFATIDIKGKALKSIEVNYAGYGLYVQSASMYALFDRGLVQMMSNEGACLGSNQTIGRLYWIGNGTALDLLRDSSKFNNVVLLSKDKDFESGLLDLVVGNYPRISLNMEIAWSKLCWKDVVSVTLEASFEWSQTYQFGPNNLNFPVYPVPNASKQPNMPLVDIQTYLMGIYASPTGCLQSYYEYRWGTIAPTIAHPDIGYSPDTNFFDPDNFISLSAMMFSGDDYLLNQVREVLERTANTMCGIGSEQDEKYCSLPSNRTFLSEPSKWTSRKNFVGSKAPQVSRTGQLMHHFVNLVPTYESIASSEQLGPNIFWTLSVLRYASTTGDIDWLLKMFPYVDLSARFLASFYDDENGMLLSPGPLWIDVLVRENFTSDSNGIAPLIFTELADCFDALNVNQEFASDLRNMIKSITINMNKFLWSPEGDHYITQLNPDGTTRDFIDYDANLMAVAFGIADDIRSKAIVSRVDRGPYTHIRGTWCSEIYYTGDAGDCYIVGGSVCGDSVVTLARIGWVDSHVRKKIGDLATFENLLLTPLQNDLIRDVWLYERYDNNGNQIRTSFYFEYPAFVSMMLREIRYGIEMKLTSVTIDPFPVADYTYSFGNVYVLYSQSHVQIQIPGNGNSRLFKIYGLKSNSVYNLSSNNCQNGQLLTSSNEGLVTFTSVVQKDCLFELSLQ